MPLLEGPPASKLVCVTKGNEHRCDKGAGNNHHQVRSRVVRKGLSISPDPCIEDSNKGSSLHQRTQSLHVKWTQADVTRLAREIYDETIAEVHLSLFGYWLREKDEHYEMAKQHIRELGLDQVRSRCHA